MATSAEWTESPIFDLDLSLPLPRRVAHLPLEVLANDRALLMDTLFLVRSPPPEVIEEVAARIAPRLVDELRGGAEVAGASFEGVLLAAAAYELTVTSMGCSTMALATPDGPLLARNLDWWPEDLLARATCHLRFHDGHRPRFQVAGFPSSAGVVTGMSARGFAACINAVGSGEAPHLDGEPVLLLLRRVLEEARDFREAVAVLTETPLLASVLFTVVGSDNHERVVIERTTRRAALRRPQGDEPLTCTNDYRLMELPGMDGLLGQTACFRYEAMGRLLGEAHARRHSDHELLGILANPRVRQQITAQHVVMRPAAGNMSVHVPTRLLAD